MITLRRGKGKELVGEDEFAELKPKLERALSIRFRDMGAHEREELVQEAWIALIKARQRGIYPDSPLAYMRKVAICDAMDAIRDDRSRPEDPTSAMFADLEADGEIDDDLCSEFDRDKVNGLLDAIGEEEARLLKLAVIEGFKPGPVREEMKITKKRYELVRGRAIRQVAGALQDQLGDSDGFGAARARLVQLLEEGRANVHQLRLAKQLAEKDHELAQALGQLNHAIHAVGGALPVEVALQSRGTSILQSASHAIESSREGAAEQASRLNPFASAPGADQATEHAGGIAAGGGSAAAGGLGATLMAGGGTAKIVLGCVATGAAAATCAATGVLPAPIDPFEKDKEPDKAPPIARVSESAPAEGQASPVENIDTYEPADPPAPQGGDGGGGGNESGGGGSPEGGGSTGEAPIPAPEPAPEPSAPPPPTPTQQQFDPLAPAPSAASSAAPAPASSSGGSSGGGSSSAGAARQEFGGP